MKRPEGRWSRRNLDDKPWSITVEGSYGRRLTLVINAELIAYAVETKGLAGIAELLGSELSAAVEGAFA